MEKIVDSNSKPIEKRLDEVYGMLSDLSPSKPVSVKEMHRGIAKKVKEKFQIHSLFNLNCLQKYL